MGDRSQQGIWCALVVTAFFSSGCATYQSKDAGHWGKFYSGTRCDFEYIGGLSTASPVWWLLLPFPLLDLPLSLVGDTVVLPVDSWSTPTSKMPLCPSAVPRE
jgi:uncharacterized protein YceK